MPPHSVHVFAWDLDVPPRPGEWNILGAEETLRARRFVFPRDRDRYVRAHATMRTVLSAYSGIPAAEISYAAGPYGKPKIGEPRIGESGTSESGTGESGMDEARNAAPGGEPPPHFNLTHSGGIAALAVSREFPLGIDLERIRPIGRDIAEHHFSPCERSALERLPPELWFAGFYRCWTSKEALLKGMGLGLNLPLDAFDVEADPRRAPGWLDARPPAKIAHGWLLVDLKPAAGVMGAVSIRDDSGAFTASSLHCFSLDPFPD